MKKLIFIFFLAISSTTNAQIYKVTSYANRVNEKWSEWKDYDCFLSMMGESKDRITIYGIPERSFYLIEATDLYRDEDLGAVFEYGAIDNNGKKCTVTLAVNSYTINDNTYIERYLYVKYEKIMHAYQFEKAD